MFQGILLRCERGELLLNLDPAMGFDVILGQLPGGSLELPYPGTMKHQYHVLQAFRDEWLNFIDAVNGHRLWDMDRETGLLTSEVIEQCAAIATPLKIEVPECVR